MSSSDHPSTPQRSRRAFWRITTCFLALAMPVLVAPAAHADTDVPVVYTDIGIYPRLDASMSSPHAGPALADGDSVTIVCEAQGQPVWNGMATIDIWARLDDGTWLPTAFLLTGTDSWGAADRCSDAGAPAASASTTAPSPPTTNICYLAYPGGTSDHQEHFLGESTTYDREESLYQVCSGFGSPGDKKPAPAMQCTLVGAAAAAFGAPGTHSAVSRACAIVTATDAVRTGDWLTTGGGFACGLVADLVASGGGVAAAGATSASGPAAVSIGLTTYKTLAAAGELVCGEIFGGDVEAWGVALEEYREARLAREVWHDGKCLKQETNVGQIGWLTVDCPA